MTNTNPMSGIFNGFDIIGAGLRAEMQRAEVITINLANMSDTGNSENTPYRRKSVVFEELLGENLGRGSSLKGLPGSNKLPQGVKITEVTEDQSPFPTRFDPNHPDAGKDGYVYMSNVNAFQEMVDLKAVQRSFQSNLVALRTYRQMITSAVQNIGR